MSGDAHRDRFVIRRWPLCAFLALLTMSCGPAGADEIVILGARYRDVLVLKSSTTYYVQIPWEGRTISVRTEEVDESTVSISDDPYYRDKLKAEYRKAKVLRASGELPLETPVDDPRFQVQARSSEGFDLYKEGEAGGGRGGAGLGVARTQVEAQLAAFGVQFAPGRERGGHPTVAGQMPQGIRIELIGPPNLLIGVEVSGSTPAAQAGAAATQMQMFASQIAPEIAPQIPAMVQEAQQSGQAQRNLSGITATISMKPTGDMVEFNFIVMATN